MSTATVVNLLVAVLIVLPVFSWVSAAILIRLAIKKPYITSLAERAISAVLKAVASTGIALIALNSFLHFWELQRPWGIGILAACLVLLEIPAAIWLSLYYSDRFRGHDDVA